jgi:hypothetical protein
MPFADGEVLPGCDSKSRLVTALAMVSAYQTLFDIKTSVRKSVL